MTARCAEITIDPRICQQIGEKLYSQPWETIWIRETLQNSLDARSTNIDYHFDTERRDGQLFYQMCCQDNGCGMTPETFIDYFLRVGASYKPDCVDPVGGFGIAKLAILAGSHWEIISKHVDTGEFRFSDEMMGDEIKRSKISVIPGKSGTIIRVWREKSLYEYKMRPPLIYSRPRPGVIITLNNERIKHVQRGRKFCDMSFGSMWYNRSQNGSNPGVHVRLSTKDGSQVFQFSHNLYSTKRCIFLDVDSQVVPEIQSNNYPFTASRESFTYDYCRIVNEQVEKITIDPITSLESKKSSFFLEIVSPKMALAAVDNPRLAESVQPDSYSGNDGYNVSYEDENGDVKDLHIKIDGIRLSSNSIGINFPFIVHRTNEKQWQDKPEDKPRNIKVIKAMRKMLDALGLSNVGVGFTLAPNTGGLFMRGLGSDFIMVSPGHIPTNNKENMFRMLMILLSHELAHYYAGMWHNQQFTSRHYYLLRDFSSKQYDILRNAFLASQEKQS